MKIQSPLLCNNKKQLLANQELFEDTKNCEKSECMSWGNVFVFVFFNNPLRILLSLWNQSHIDAFGILLIYQIIWWFAENESVQLVDTHFIWLNFARKWINLSFLLFLQIISIEFSDWWWDVCLIQSWGCAADLT